MFRKWGIAFFVILLAFLPAVSVFAEAMDIPNDPDPPPNGVAQSIIFKPPYHYDQQPYSLNLDIWHKLHKIVYGEPSDVPSNRFKNAMQLPNQPIQWDTGHFLLNGKQGEYEYLGFDTKGAPYYNEIFPDDSSGDTSLDQKRWIYHPKDNLPDSYPYKPKTTGYEDEVMDPFWNDSLNKAIPFPLRNGTNGDNDRPGYMFVNAFPKVTAYGSGTMFHQRPNGGYWYQSFQIPPLEEKKPTPVKASIQILSDLPVTGEPGDREIPVTVKVSGDLQDGSYQTAQDRAIHYTGDDITSWRIELQNGMFAGAKAVDIRANDTTNSARAFGNHGEATFTFMVTWDQLNDLKNQNVDSIPLKGSVKANFPKGHYVQDYSSTNAPFKAERLPLMCGFQVFPTVIVSDPAELYPERFGYNDSSIGSIYEYDIKITNSANGKSQRFTYGDIPKGEKVDQQKIKTDLASFIKSYFPDTKSKPAHFQIEQTVVELGTGTAPSCYQDMDVRMQENPVYTITFPEPNIPNHALDIVDFPATDKSKMSDFVSRSVQVDGYDVDPDYFFSGRYVFGIGNDGLKQVDVQYQSVDGLYFNVTKWVQVHDTKPTAQYKLDGNSFKQNRKMTATNDSLSANDSYVTNLYPLHYRWQFVTNYGDENSLKVKTDTDASKVFLYKEPGTYTLELVAYNDLGRESDPYYVTYPILEDQAPEIILHPWNSQSARGEKVHFYNDVQSIDQDKIQSAKTTIYYDSQNNGTYDTQVAAFDTAITEYMPTRLGNYRIVTEAKEEFQQSTLDEFVTPADRKTAKQQTEFQVDNLSPSSDLYVNIPVIKPKLNLFLMNDAKLDPYENSYIIGNNVKLRNYMTEQNTLTDIAAWDMRTYEYTTGATKTYNTGTSYPPETASYGPDLNGYLGTLHRDSVSDNGSNKDFGHDETKLEYQDFSMTCTNTVHTWSKKSGSGSSPIDSCPSTKYVSGNGFSGSIPKVSTDAGPPSTSEGPDGTDTYQTWTANYFGTLTKTVTFHVPDWRYVPNYTGFYSGTAYKYVRQPYANPWTSNEAKKYVIYVSDGDISELDDLKMALSKTDAALLLVGQPSIESQIAHEKFFPNDKSIDAVLKDVFDYIASSNPAIQDYTTLIGQPFKLSTNTFDFEGDSIGERKFQYIQDGYYFDNSQGLESYATPYYNEGSYTNFQAGVFNKPGKYEVKYRVRDQPSADANFADFAYYSNESTLNITAHRKPIAKMSMDWDFKVDRGIYTVSFTDESYDLDHQYSRPDRGAVQKKLRYQRNGGEWIYGVPTELVPGTYTFELMVEDPEHTWSDPYRWTENLPAAPPIQLEAKARTELGRFSLQSVPASENLVLYDVWTRWPYNLSLNVAMYQNGVAVAPVKQVNFSSSTGWKTGNDIEWNDISYNIPATLKDGDYTIRVTAVGAGGVTAYQEFPVRVSTPVDLQAVDHPAEVVINDVSYNFQASTSKYVNLAQVTLFKNTPYQQTLTMTGQSDPYDAFKKVWTTTPYKIPAAVTEGYYLFEYKATTTNGNTGLQTTTSYVVAAYIKPKVNHTAEWEKNRQQYNLKISKNPNAPRGPDVFWAGESFVLSADTSPGTSVRVTMSGTGKQMSLTPDTAHRTWQGELSDPSFQSLKNGVYDFKFDLTYGPTATPRTKSATVSVLVLDSWSNYYRIHRQE